MIILHIILNGWFIYYSIYISIVIYKNKKIYASIENRDNVTDIFFREGKNKKGANIL